METDAGAGEAMVDEACAWLGQADAAGGPRARAHTGLLEGANAVDDLDVLPSLTSKEEKARRKPRHPFTEGQLSTLFAEDWYRPDSTRWRGKMATDLGARYWVPLVCMFHGNRVREVLQLVASDVAVNQGVSVVQFREEMDGEQAAMLAAGVVRSLKNDPSRRVVPLHPTLLALGFGEYVEQRRGEAGANALLFPSSIPKPGGKAPMLGRAYEQAFLRHARDGLAFGRGFGNHSFRHQLEDRIRDAQRPGAPVAGRHGTGLYRAQARAQPGCGAHRGRGQ